MNNLIAQQIREKRQEKKITQTELSKKTQLSRNTIVNFETGKRSPRMKDLEKIANALNISIRDLV